MGMVDQRSHAVGGAVSLFLLLAGSGGAIAAESTSLEVLSLSKLPHHEVVLVRGALSGSFARPWDLSPTGHLGSYRVPVWLAYPLKRFHGGAIVEPAHPAGGADYLSHLSTATEQFNTLFADPANGGAEFDLTTLLDGGDFLWEGPPRGRGAYVYAFVVSERSLLNVYKAPPFQNGPFQGSIYGIRIDPGFFITRTFDRAVIARDVSRVVRDVALLRQAVDAFAPTDGTQKGLKSSLLRTCSKSGGCDARDVMAVGFSAQSGPIGDWLFSGLNTGLAAQVDYADGFRFGAGLVFDGSVRSGVNAALCVNYFHNQGPEPCPGAPDPREGKAFVLNSEGDVQWDIRYSPLFYGPLAPDKPNAGFSVRPDQGSFPSTQYRVYEVATDTHIPDFLFDPRKAGLISYPEAPYTNWLDVRPVYRAMTENMRLWMRHGVDPPPSALIEMGEERQVALEPEFPFPPPPDDFVTLGGVQPYFVPPSRTAPGFDRARGYDFNVEGGVRLTNVRTTLTIPGAPPLSFGAPLGVHRPQRCNNLAPLTHLPGDPLYCPNLFGNQDGFEPPGWRNGDFIPYKDAIPGNPAIFQDELDAVNAANGTQLENPCSLYYPTHAHYSAAVAFAAAYAAGQRWVLPEEVSALVAAAEQKAKDFPGCVPR
jgi:hypothetical protein